MDDACRSDLNMCKRAVFRGCRLLVLAASLIPTTAHATPTVGAPIASPAVVPVGRATDLTITSQITGGPGDPRVIATGVYLQRVDTNNKFIAVMGTMRDDGTGGDAVAGDLNFTLRLTVTESTRGEWRLRVSAPFERTPLRVFSSVTVVPVGVPTSSPSPLFTATHTATPAFTVSPTSTAAPTGTATVPPTPTPTLVPTTTPTIPPTDTLTPTAAPTDTSTTTPTLTSTATAVPTDTATTTPTDTASSTPTATPTGTPAATATASPTATVDPRTFADLGIYFLYVSSTTPPVGSTVDVLVMVASFGPSSATGVTARFLVPAGYTMTGVGFVDGSYNSATGDWTIGSMGEGELAQLYLSVRVNPAGPYDLVATITGSSQPDPDPTNNRATEIVRPSPPPNRPPVADAGANQTAATNMAVVLDGTGSSDADADTLTFQWTFVLRPVNSTATLAGADTATPSFVPDLGGTYRAQLIVTDSHGAASAADTVTISAQVLNLPPVITSTAVTIAATGQPYGYDVEAHDPDAGDALTFFLMTAPAGMMIDPATGLIQWTPADDQGGPQAVTVRVQDAGGLVATQSFAAQVSSPANRAPAAIDDTYTVRVNESLSMPAPGILANDTDADGDTLAATLLTSPTNGTLDFHADGSFVYTPQTLAPGGLVLAENVNLAVRVPGVVVNASSCCGVSGTPCGRPECAVDESLLTSWVSQGGCTSCDTQPFFEVVFPEDVTVTQVQIFGHRNSFLSNTAIAGIFQLFAADGTELHNAGVVEIPTPDHDATLVLEPALAAVRRVRFTVTAGSGGVTYALGFAEMKVIGSTPIRREAPVEPNLVQLLPATARASSWALSNVAGGAIDANDRSNWYGTTAGDWFEIDFSPHLATVTNVQAANPQGRPDGFGTSLGINCNGRFELLDPSGAVLFDSGVVNTPTGAVDPSIAFSLPVPDIAGVQRVRYTSVSCPGSAFPPGFSSVHVFGSVSLSPPLPAFKTAIKFWALQDRGVHSTTLVANLTDDNGDGVIDPRDIPDIVVPVESLGSQLTGEIKVLSGEDGRELLTLGGPNLVSPWSELAGGDIDADGVPEVLAVHSDGNHLIAFEHTGQVKWVSDANAMPAWGTESGMQVGGAISIANLDAGARPHIVVGASVFDAGGKLLGDGRTLGGTAAGTGVLRSAVSAVADLDLDGRAEIVAGPTAYRLVNGQLTKVWQRIDRPDGYVAIANLDNDPFAEIAIVADGLLYVLNHDGSDAEVWNPPTHAPLPIPVDDEGGRASGQAGAPLIADVDGDGFPEIGIATASAYLLFDRDGTVRWHAPISDHTSHMTGSTAFDFDADGEIEIVYRDERFLRILRGRDGVVLARHPISSSTWSEEPVVADVDNDGHADIVVSSNPFGSPSTSGVIVLQDVANKWTRTRRIWNQHSYHITNVAEDGRIPAAEPPHWLLPSLNGFRFNAFVPGETPDQADSFTYLASDGILQSNVATVRITVTAPNSPPQFTSAPITTAAVGVPYIYGPRVTDPDPGDVLTFSLPTAPAGMMIDPATGLIRWTPTAGQLGSQDVGVKVQDARGLFALQGYTVQVVDAVTVPDVVGQLQASAEALVLAAGLAVGTVSAQYDVVMPVGTVINQNPAAGTLVVPGAPVNIVVSLGPPPTDTPTPTPTPTRSPTDTPTSTPTPAGPPPVAAITTPVDGGIVTEPIDIIGTASSSTLADWTLAVRFAGEPAFTVLASATTSVTDGVLGRFDPTLLLNGIYELRLTAVDVSGRLAIAEASMIVEGEQKVGHFRISFNDLTLPLSGIPIILTRTYDSRVKSTEDFGVGWTLDIGRGFYQHNRTPGLGWEILPGRFGFPCQTVNELRSHITQVRLSDRESYTFALTLSNAAGVMGGCEATASFRFIDGETVGATLDILGNTQVLYLNGDDRIVDPSTFLAYDPQPVRLTTIDGRQFDFDATGHITRIRDPNDNTISITPDGILHSSGESVAFVRDPQGRIATITDPAGKTLAYTYDAQGDLATFTDQAGNLTTFHYDTDHHLIDILDPLGNRAVRNEYDAEGRLVATIDAQGNRVEVAHNLGARQEVIRDRLGRVTIHEYDGAGNVIATTDALGNRRQFTYDGRGNQLTETDPLGRVAARTYDAADNVLSATDFDGNTTTATYNAHRQVLTTTDAEGKTTSYAYDAKGNRETTTDPDGGVTRYTYDSAGRVRSTTDPLGQTTQFTYDASGRLAVATDPLGVATTITYDANGNRLSENEAGRVRQFAYDGLNRLIAETDPLGNRTSRVYEGLGDRRLASSTDANGNTTGRDHDDRGNLVQITFADGSMETTTYDAADQITGVIDREGNEHRYEYDAAGRRTREVHPDGSATATGYDAVGRTTSKTDERGNTTTFTLAPNRETVTDALGNQTVHEFDSRQRRNRVIDASGRSTRYEYDGSGRLTKTIFADGTSMTTAYDLVGRKVSETDQAGRRNQFAYDAAGRLARVTDAAGGITTYAYDAVGNLVVQTDAEGRATLMEYDAANRLTRRIRPLGQAESFAYEANGNLTSYTDFNGETTTFAYDVNDRLVRKNLPGGAVVTYAYSATGLRTQAGGDAFAYDSRGRLVAETKASGEVLVYGYDAAGNRTSLTTPQGTTTYTYDALNRLASVVDTTGATTYAYDAVGNLTSTVYPNGTTTTCTYDSLNRLVATETNGPAGPLASYTYTLDPTGRRLRVVETGPATTGRTVDYAYDAVGRLASEAIDEPGAGADQQITYTYDAVGNRLTKTVVAGSETTQTLYSYDGNDRLLSETATITLTSHPRSHGTRYMVAGYGLSPFLAIAGAAVFAYGRRGGRRTRRQYFCRSLVALALTAATVFAPAVAQAGMLDALRPRAAAAQMNVSTITYAYDDNGNLLTRNDGTLTDTYDYDDENRLIAGDVRIGPNAGVVSFTYDADGNRVARTAAGVMTTFLVDRNREVADVLIETTGGSAVSYTHGHDLVSQTRPGTGTRFYHYDGAGSTRNLTDTAGAVTDAYGYDAFGVLLAVTGSTPNNYLYRGEQLDPNVSFYYLRARYYAAATGRFLTVDPEQGSIFDPVSLHRYLYANADPVNHLDPTGRSTMMEITMGAAIVGALVGFVVGYVIGGPKGGLIGAAAGFVVGAIAVRVTRVAMAGTRFGETLAAIGRLALRTNGKVSQPSAKQLVEQGRRIGQQSSAAIRRRAGTAQTVEEVAVDRARKFGAALLPILPEEQVQKAEELSAEIRAVPDGDLAMLVFIGGVVTELAEPGLGQAPRLAAERLLELLVQTNQGI